MIGIMNARTYTYLMSLTLSTNVLPCTDAITYIIIYYYVIVVHLCIPHLCCHLREDYKILAVVIYHQECNSQQQEGPPGGLTGNVDSPRTALTQGQKKSLAFHSGFWRP